VEKMKKLLIFGCMLVLFASIGFSDTTYWKNATANSGTGWTNPANAYTDDSTNATTTLKNKQHVWYGYNFTEIYGATSIDSVEIMTDYCTEDSDDYIGVYVSCNAGGTYSTEKLFVTQQCSAGFNKEIWDITSLGEGACSSPPTVAELDDLNFRVRIESEGLGGPSDYWDLDWVPVQVNYTVTPSIVGFTITLPGESVVNSEPGGNATTGIEFNNTGQNVQIVTVPCVVGTAACQTSTVPIFNFTNVGNVELNYSVSINESLPAQITLYCDTDNDPAGNTTVTTSEWEVDNSVLASEWVDLWCWVDFIDVSVVDQTNRRFYNNATEQ
jgi:hypothetical protein